MPDVTLAGSLALNLDALQALISNVPFFLTWTGAANAAAARLKHIFEGELGYPIHSVQIASNVLTVTTREAHGRAVNDVIQIDGADLGAESGCNVAGEYTVVSVPTANTFTVAKTAANFEEAVLDAGFVLPGKRPYVCVCAEDGGGNYEGIGTGGVFVDSDEFEVLVEGDVSAEYRTDSKNAVREMNTKFGQLLDGIMALQGTADYLCINSLERTRRPAFLDRELQTNVARFERWQAAFRVKVGLTG
jgi:hypothetical protein